MTTIQAKQIEAGSVIEYVTASTGETRRFQIIAIEASGKGAKSGENYVVARVRDLDKHGEEKSRTLHCKGIFPSA